ncbi:MAG: hypothetical protein LQ351_005359 [Letrouitia transgressa]|nr:MAG: hypothetical protein LQ351_005359 [Letrouitia transgressa]
MESAGLRQRKKPLPIIDDGTDRQNKSSRVAKYSEPPKYIIDLSLPPAERYKRVATDFKPTIIALPVLFDDLVKELRPGLSITRARRIARLTLRRLYSEEETEEIRGIYEVTGIEMYLLVALNVLLDLFMGCTSGGIKVSEGQNSRMLHFRTLDWGMDPLRKIVVHLDFVEQSGGPVVASSITYVGFVGCLTGVRKGLSTSLNFRPKHNAINRLDNFRLYFHNILVLLGFRPTISSLLRQCILPYNCKGEKTQSQVWNLDSIEHHFLALKSTAAYLIFCDGERVVIMEKDHDTAIVRSSKEFAVACNHDQDQDPGTEIRSNLHAEIGMDFLLEESISRQDILTNLWNKSRSRSKTISPRRIEPWIDKRPITDTETHFASLMDPKAGRIKWTKLYLEPP